MYDPPGGYDYQWSGDSILKRRAILEQHFPLTQTILHVAGALHNVRP